MVERDVLVSMSEHDLMVTIVENQYVMIEIMFFVSICLILFLVYKGLKSLLSSV